VIARRAACGPGSAVAISPAPPERSIQQDGSRCDDELDLTLDGDVDACPTPDLAS
jgi:hypothetical protein